LARENLDPISHRANPHGGEPALPDHQRRREEAEHTTMPLPDRIASPAPESACAGVILRLVPGIGYRGDAPAGMARVLTDNLTGTAIK